MDFLVNFQGSLDLCYLSDVWSVRKFHCFIFLMGKIITCYYKTDHSTQWLCAETNSGQAYQGPCLYSMQYHLCGMGLQIIWHAVLKPPAGLQFLCRGGGYGGSTLVLDYIRHCHITLEFPVGVGALQQEQVFPQALLSGRPNTICYSAFYRQEFTYTQKVGKRVSFLPWSSITRRDILLGSLLKSTTVGNEALRLISISLIFSRKKKSVYIPLHKIL